MIGALEELFHEELTVARAEARGEGRAEGQAKERQAVMDKLITERGWDPQEAANFVGLSFVGKALA